MSLQESNCEGGDGKGRGEEPGPAENYNCYHIVSVYEGGGRFIEIGCKKKSIFSVIPKKVENVFSREMPGKGLFFHIGGTSTRWCDRHIKLHRKAQNSFQRSSILKHFARVTRIGLKKKIIRSLYISLLCYIRQQMQGVVIPVKSTLLPY